MTGLMKFGMVAMAWGLALAGCDQSVDPGATDGLGDSVAVNSVTVRRGADERVVVLGSLATVDVQGSQLVRLSDVAGAAFDGLELSIVTADFAASDGFRPGDSPNCTGLLPVSGETLARGYIDPATRNLAWDADLGFPGCLKVLDMADLILADKEQ